MKKYLSIYTLLLCLLFAFSCDNDEADEPIDPEENPCGFADTISFSLDIVPLLETYCYFPGSANVCHADGGFAPGFYTSHAGVFEARTKIMQRAITIGDMPPTYSTEGPTSMTECDQEKLRLWLEDGAPNN